MSYSLISRFLFKIFIFLILFSIISCGKTSNSQKNSSIKIDILADLNSFSLTKITETNFLIKGCISGYEADLKGRWQEIIEISPFEKNCKIVLKKFKYREEIYTTDKQNAEDFISGNIIPFYSDATNSTINLYVESQLKQDIKDLNIVKFRFLPSLNVFHFNYNNLKLNFEGIFNSNPSKAIEFEIDNMKYSGFAPNGAKKIDVNINCSDLGSEKEDGYYCGEINLRNISYLLIQKPIDSILNQKILDDITSEYSVNQINMEDIQLDKNNLNIKIKNVTEKSPSYKSLDQMILFKFENSYKVFSFHVPMTQLYLKINGNYTR